MENTSYLIDDRKLFIYEMALRSAIYAAINRNSPYKKGSTNDEKDKIRKYWKNRLCEIAQEVKLYGGSLYVEFFVQIIKILWKQLKGKFPKHKFRISHAQKSLAVFLKYLWCYGEIEEPHICPIDSLIISFAKKAEKNMEFKPWTQMEDEKEYREVITALQKYLEASKFSLAKWELEYFNADRRTQNAILKFIKNTNNINKK